MDEKKSSASRRGFIFRLALSVIVLALWFWTQSLLGARSSPNGGIDDSLHDVTAALNGYFHVHAVAADALLILSSGIVDGLGLFLLGRWLFGGTARPFVGLVILMALRQLMQSLCALPPPQDMIWHYPGFPSLLVTYHVANDFFFSGHTAIVVFAGTELIRFRRGWLNVLAVLLVLFEVSTVLVLRAHYTMDVFTGLVAALWVASLSEKLSPRLDRLLNA
jgi:hypothetical protein